MDHHLDTSWCPGCDRQILPKRFLVPVSPPPSTPVPPPSSPRSASPKNNTSDASATRRSKNATTRQRGGGLVHGTGRVKPNGALKRSDSLTKTQPPSPLTAKPVAPIKHRTVIDQGPIPLYCSDECQMKDINDSFGALDLNYDPRRWPPPVPRDSYGAHTISETESDSSGSSDSHSTLSFESSSPHNTHVSSSIAVLAAMYNFPPIPAPAPVFPEPSSSETHHVNHYQSGIMMAGRRLKEVFSHERPKCTPYGTNHPPEPRKPIPGWTDGSTAWRASMYSFSAPNDSATDPSQREGTGRAYQSFSASPHRSRGVNSTLSDSGRMPVSCTSFPSKRASETAELYAKYSQSLSRRSESRISLTSSPTSMSPPGRRERSILKPGAEGKLLVPDVKMRVHGGSSSSLSSAWCGSSYLGSSRRSTRNSSADDVRQAAIVASSLPVYNKATVETRSWSYDNLKTYPVMQLPPKKEKHIEKRVVDGHSVDVEVEVEVLEPMKCLFLFPGKES